MAKNIYFIKSWLYFVGSQLTRQSLLDVSSKIWSQEANDGPLGYPTTSQSDIRSPKAPLNILQSILVLSYINHSQLDGYTSLQKSWQVCTPSTLPNSYIINQIRFKHAIGPPDNQEGDINWIHQNIAYLDESYWSWTI